MSFLRVPLRASAFPRFNISRVSLPRRPFNSSSSRRYNQGYNRRFLAFLDDVPQDTVFWGIIGLNGLVFATSWWAKKKLEVERNPALFIWMRKHFATSWSSLSAGRIWTPFTSMFAHADIPHILFNGFTFYFMAPITLQILGSRQFLFLYLGGGAIASLGSIAYNKVFRNRDPYSLGASAAIYSAISFLAFSAPKMTLLLYGIIPVPIWLAVSGIFTYDLYRTAADKGGTDGTAAHVGGIMAGAGYYFLRLFRIL
ncbi:hypothetical protein C8F04DRAFT_1059331 [Mycena alexandri]|uniref:Peptidase S54 rhomboid domain-containing protein n=1 Tax=Mycena alexandri TaxID=1745969 RepID=A0AAD6TJL4_9AGAR|nr:hypothetical protein C8F04DRAFT_1059331 [Mycena alexandri]